MSAIKSWDLDRLVTLRDVLNALDRSTSDFVCECGSYTEIDQDYFERIILSESGS